MKIAVTSKSFSKNTILRAQLLERFPDSYFNDEGVNFSVEALIEFLRPCDGAIIGLEPINDHILKNLPKLKVIGKYGVGLDKIDFSAMRTHDVSFGYTAGVNKRGVAELALQMMMVLIRKSYHANLQLRAGQWVPQFGNNLTHKKIGILGLGNVGQDLVKLLKPFECTIYCCDIKPDHEFIKKHDLKLVSLEEIFSLSDVVTIHIPFNKKNTKLVDERLLSLMQPHGILINTSRGGLVDEEALLQKLQSKKIQAAGFDVFLEEPCQKNALLNLENFYSTPHIGGSSVESVLAMGAAAINGLSHASKVSENDFIE
jgi:phosphoglycerate dehydrogenase-like enzyme